MKKTMLACLLAVASGASANPKETSPDLLAPRRAAPKAAAGVTADDVGDVDSFGRSVQYLGVTQSAAVTLQTGPCAPPDPAAPNDRCIVLNPAPSSTPVNETDLAQLKLPAKATHSLICFAVTPLESYQFHNTTGVFQPVANYNLRPTIHLENDVLDDPALIDPNTGLPFGGAIDLALPTHSENRSLAVDERASTRFTLSRSCIGGIISKNALTQGYGLTAAQADDFFKKPITLSFGVQGNVKLVDSATYLYGIRLYGD